MNLDALRAELIRDEGFRLKPYRCTSGKLTIGVGRNLGDRGITKAEALVMLDTDIGVTQTDLDVILPEWRGFSEARQRALLNTVFNLGRVRLAGFRRMLDALRRRDWEEAWRETLAANGPNRTVIERSASPR